MKMVKEIRDFLNGLAFGITEIVPGVSGGTVAIILGFYGELIETVNHFTEDYRKYLRFLFPFLLGMTVGILVFSSIINYLLTNHSFPTMLFFIGLIVGIVPIIYSKVKEPGRWFTPKEIALIISPILLLFVLSN
jgi:putative membrane protein